MKKMKKLIPLLVLVIVAVGIFGSFKVKKGEIGVTYESSEGIEFTVNEIAFADVIDGWGGANDDFWKPLDESNCNVGKRYTLKQYKNKYGLVPKDENDRIIYISYTAENLSKYDRFIDETGLINYDNGYTYSEGKLAYRVSEKGVWKELQGGLNLPKLDGGKYEFRAYTVVPKEVVESDKSLTLNLYGYTFELK